MQIEWRNKRDGELCESYFFTGSVDAFWALTLLKRMIEGLNIVFGGFFWS